MQSLALAQTSLAAGVDVVSAFTFCKAVRLGKPKPAFLLIGLIAVVLSAPLLILPRGAGLLRFIAAALAVQTVLRLYDLFMNPADPQRPKCLAFAGYQLNPFLIVWPRSSLRTGNTTSNDLDRFIINTALGLLAAGLMAVVFRINWLRYPFALEHCAKVISFLLAIQFLLNGLAAVFRLAGLPAVDFAGNFFLSATPAEFWRRYNRPVEQFFYQYIFRPAARSARPLRATIAVFAFSALIHEYIFDIAARRILGYQALFFMIHGAGAAMTLRLRLKGPVRVPAVMLNSAFNIATAYLFFASMNACLPFYVSRR